MRAAAGSSSACTLPATAAGDLSLRCCGATPAYPEVLQILVRMRCLVQLAKPSPQHDEDIGQTLRGLRGVNPPLEGLIRCLNFPKGLEAHPSLQNVPL